MKRVKLFEEFIQDEKSREVNEAGNILGTLIAAVLAYGINVFIDVLWPTLERAWKLISPQKHHKVIRALGKDKTFNKEMFEVITSTGKYKGKLYFNKFVLRDVIAEVPAFKEVVQKFGAEEDVNNIAEQIADVIVNHRSWIKDRLAEVQNEAFEYGDQLLTDPEGVQFKDRLKVLKLPEEPNTYDEQRFIEMLKDWFNNEYAESALGSILWQLLPLKKKFPKVLEPSKGRNLYEGNTLYRGTMIPLATVLNLKGQWKRYKGVGLLGDAIEMDTKFNWSFKSDKGFTSFTPASETAEEFADQISYEEFKPYRPGYGIVKRLSQNSIGGKIPVILKIKDTHPQALFNPQFTTSISAFTTEYEIFVVGARIQVDGIIIPRWNDYENAAATEGFEDLDKYFNIK
jgi:hypothetical protein